MRRDSSSQLRASLKRQRRRRINKGDSFKSDHLNRLRAMKVRILKTLTNSVGNSFASFIVEHINGKFFGLSQERL